MFTIMFNVILYTHFTVVANSFLQPELHSRVSQLNTESLMMLPFFIQPKRGKVIPHSAVLARALFLQPKSNKHVSDGVAHKVLSEKHFTG